MAGDDHEYVTNTVETFCEVRAGDQVWRKFDAGQVANVFAVGHHGFKQVEFDNAAQPDIAAATRKLQRQRRSPGPGADNCD